MIISHERDRSIMRSQDIYLSVFFTLHEGFRKGRDFVLCKLGMFLNSEKYVYSSKFFFLIWYIQRRALNS